MSAPQVCSTSKSMPLSKRTIGGVAYLEFPALDPLAFARRATSM